MYQTDGQKANSGKPDPVVVDKDGKPAAVQPAAVQPTTPAAKPTNANPKTVIVSFIVPAPGDYLTPGRQFLADL